MTAKSEPVKVQVDSCTVRDRPTDAVAEQFLALIRTEMDKRKLSVRGLAQLIGVPHQNVYQTMNHPGAVRTSTIVKWCTALDLDPELKAKRAKR